MGLATAMNANTSGYYDNRPDWERVPERRTSNNLAVKVAAGVGARAVSYGVSALPAQLNASPAYYQYVHPTVYQTLVSPLNAIAR